MQINVCNKHHGVIKNSDYIGRGSPLGNPFKLTPNEPRGSTLVRYKAYLDQKILAGDSKITSELNRLYNKGKREPLNLVCFCAPKPCHGDIIKATLLEAFQKHN